MPNSDLWPQIHSERKALAADLDGLDETAWATPSLCSGWTVRDVLAHMTATAKMSPASFLPKLIGSGFSFGRLQAKDIAAERGSSPADTLARFKDRVDSTGRPPGPPDTMRGEVLVHSEDIRRPLGIAHTYPPDLVRRVADFFKGSNLIIHSKSRIAGVTLRASDADWSHGSGPEAVGPLLSLVMAMTGRKAALADLNGAGVEILRSRP
ncbi:MAG TPA: maleylpyruvate isomerase family mycothiol-dependent enzyme [Acidimicrobiales bacterium]|nr:maleylpyruvate isomerase family mycothiol-dependent enzyme [Acidimicrobiales bacterium]